jgi:NAD(P)-dependent dehydrogenase (short-subunit alcohol dehydrogenase family)
MSVISLKNQRVVIIGGSSGMGYAVAEGAVAEGATVVVASSDKVKVETAATRLGPSASARVLDVRDEVHVAAFFDAVGPFDHLVFTAGEAGMGRARGSISQLDISAASDDLQIRFWGALVAIKHAHAHLSPSGSITLTDGVLALKPMKGFPMGTAFGGMIQHLVRGLAVDMAPLRVNSVCPGLVMTERLASYPEDVIRQMTERQALPRAAKAAEAAQAFLYLMRGGYTTGQTVIVDGGATLG